jgi:hypothetical protein
VIALPLAVAAGGQSAERDADSLAQKVVAILRFAQTPEPRARVTPVSENELNAFLRLSDQLPLGVTEPDLTMLGQGAVAARAIVDLDAVRRTASSGWLDPTRLLSGRLPVEARGVLRAEDGVAHFSFQDATVSGIPVPKRLVQEIVTYYSRSREFPLGVDLDAPFELPARIREIQVNAHQAILVQR